jgi:hypothetical protein
LSLISSNDDEAYPLFAEIDTLLDRISKVLAGGTPLPKNRSNSKLSELLELLLSRPVATVPLGAKLLKVTHKAIDLMLAWASSEVMRPQN